MRSAKALSRKLGGNDAAMCRPSRVQPFGPRPVGKEGQKTAAHAGRKPERISCCLCIELQKAGDGRRCGDRADDPGGVETARMESATRHTAKACCNLIAEHDACRQLGPADINFVAGGEGSGNHHAARMDDAVGESIVEVARVGESAMDERSDCCWGARAVNDDS